MIHTQPQIIDEFARLLQRIKYRPGYIHRDYEYTIVSDGNEPTRRIPLAAFADDRPSYRNACLGVVFANGAAGEQNVLRHSKLGAPLIFEVTGSDVDLWSIRSKNRAFRLGGVPQRELPALFTTHRDEWNPERIFRAKALDKREAVQLDFCDAGYLAFLESEIKERLGTLIKRVLNETIKAHTDSVGHKPSPEAVFRLVFRFIAAKTLLDRKHPAMPTTTNPANILAYIEDYYNTAAEGLKPPGIDDDSTLRTAWDLVSKSLHFQNLSVDDLAFVYENTLITKETRKTFGTHSTPTYIAEYIVRKLPFETLPQRGRRVLEPCSGNGVFFVSAMRRLGELLPPNTPDAQRHDYFQKRLSGIEIDNFAIEVCRLSLMLADYPNQNNWKLLNQDVFEGRILEEELRKADCVLCNPPFENFSSSEKSKYASLQTTNKAREVLLRVLAHAPLLLGIVLPKSFLTDSSCRSIHQQVIKTYGNVDLVELPDGVFTHSDIETVLLIAWGKRISGSPKTCKVNCITVRRNALKDFRKYGQEPLGRKETLTLSDYQTSPLSIWIPEHKRLWRYLSDYPRLDEIAETHRGIEYNIPLQSGAIMRKAHTDGKSMSKRQALALVEQNRARVFSDTPKRGFVQALLEAQDIQQYHLHHTAYLTTQEDLCQNKAYRLPWEKPKLLVTAARTSRGPWRIAAIQDRSGLFAYRNLYGIWPKATEDIAPLLAIINSPVANAYVYFNTIGKHNPTHIIDNIPIPNMRLAANTDLKDKVTQFEKAVSAKAGRTTNSDLCRMLLEIDAEVLRLYDLPPVLERELLDVFAGDERPVPFVRFGGYYPDGFTAFLPLHHIISEDFKNASAGKLRADIKPFKDTIVHEALKFVTRR